METFWAKTLISNELQVPCGIDISDPLSRKYSRNQKTFYREMRHPRGPHPASIEEKRKEERGEMSYSVQFGSWPLPHTLPRRLGVVYKQTQK